MHTQFRGLIAATLLTVLAPGCTVFKPALAHTNVRETSAVELHGGKPDPNKDANGLVDGLLGYVSSGIQAAIDSDAARYSAVYSGSAIISDFWDAGGKGTEYKTLTLQRKIPADGASGGAADQRGAIASTFVVTLERVGDSTKFSVRPTKAIIDRAMAKLLTSGVIAFGAWFTDRTTLLNVEVKWKVEDLAVASPTSTEATVSIAGYDMTLRDEQGHGVNYFEEAGGAAGVLDFPHVEKRAGLYRISATVTEKDPFNVDRSVEAEKTLIKDLIEAMKKATAKDDA